MIQAAVKYRIDIAVQPEYRTVSMGRVVIELALDLVFKVQITTGDKKFALPAFRFEHSYHFANRLLVRYMILKQ